MTRNKFEKELQRLELESRLAGFSEEKLLEWRHLARAYDWKWYSDTLLAQGYDTWGAYVIATWEAFITWRLQS